AAVHAHLRFLLHHADDCVGRVVDQDCFPDGIRFAEDVGGQLVAEEDDAAALLFVGGVDPATAGHRIVHAAVAVRTVCAEHAAVDGLALPLHRRAPRHDLAVDALELRHLRAKHLHIVDARTDPTSRRHALPG